jgi:hypothetical protein
VRGIVVDCVGADQRLMMPFSTFIPYFAATYCSLTIRAVRAPNTREAYGRNKPGHDAAAAEVALPLSPQGCMLAASVTGIVAGAKDVVIGR